MSEQPLDAGYPSPAILRCPPVCPDTPSRPSARPPPSWKVRGPCGSGLEDRGQGKTRGTVAMNMVELCTNQSIAAILPNSKVFSSHYLYQNLDSRYDELRSLSTGDGGRGGLNLQIIKSMEINLPCLEEQVKISNFLKVFDEKLFKTKSQLEFTKKYKQGLLQQMFI
jgi:restriction endonuclease S subunit